MSFFEKVAQFISVGFFLVFALIVVGSCTSDLFRKEDTFQPSSKQGLLGFLFKNEQVDRQGTKSYSDGSEFVGELKGALPHGHGALTWPNGTEYVGEFKDGKPHGYGTATFADGDKYVGEHIDGRPHGQGTMTWADGYEYVGEFENGEMHGRGAMTSWYGGILEGMWENGDFLGEYDAEPLVNSNQ